MNKKFTQITALCGLFFMLASYQFIKTQLRVTVLDDLGNIRPKSKVILYEKTKDFNADKPVFGPIEADEKGRAIFVAVGKGPYLIEAQDGEYSNDFGGQQTNVLEEGKINKVNIIISK